VYAGEGKLKMGNNKSGFIWDACKKAGVSYRTYGEFASKDRNMCAGPKRLTWTIRM